MSGGWAVRVADGDAASLSRLLPFDGVEVAEVEGAVWARGNRVNDDLDRALRSLPSSGRYSMLADGQLVSAGRRVPKGWIPHTAWQPLARWIVVDLPPAALPGELVASVPGNGTGELVAIRIVRSSAERPASALMTSLDAWVAYCATAPEVRLKPLAFAVADDRRVLVRGTPLPPLAGLRYTCGNGAAVPCGFELSPRLEPTGFRHWLQADDDLLVFAVDGSYERIAADDFVAASRSAARASAEEATHD
jgi:hypothetical protein